MPMVLECPTRNRRASCERTSRPEPPCHGWGRASVSRICERTSRPGPVPTDEVARPPRPGQASAGARLGCLATVLSARSPVWRKQFCNKEIARSRRPTRGTLASCWRGCAGYPVLGFRADVAPPCQARSPFQHGEGLRFTRQVSSLPARQSIRCVLGSGVASASAVAWPGGRRGVPVQL
jgi:hypothetical protein